MTRSMSNNCKRIIAGMCALLVVGGAVPVQPLADAFTSWTALVASANIPTTDFTFDFNEVTGEVSEADIANISEASIDSVESWILANATAISQANPNFDGNYYFLYRDNVGGETRLCALGINGTDMASSEELEMYFNSSSEPDISVLSSDEEKTLAGEINYVISNGNVKFYFCENDATTVTTLNELYDAVKNGGTGGLIKIGADISEESSYLDILTASTIDLNGHVLTLKYIDTYTDVTITDSVGGGKLKITDYGYGIYTNRSDTTLTIESGTIEFTHSDTYGIEVRSGALIINGGTITSAGCSIYRDGGAVTINGGTITGGFRESNGDLTITGGIFSFDVTDLVASGVAVEKIGDVWAVGKSIDELKGEEQQEEQAHFVKTTLDTIGSDLANNLKPVSQDVVEAWTAENDAALKAERAAASGTGEACLFVVYGYDNDHYLCKRLNESNIWKYDSYLIDNIQYEMEYYDAIVYYATEAQGDSAASNGFSLIDSSDAIKGKDLPEIAPDDAMLWVKAHIAEIKAAVPNYENWYVFTFKYNGSYYFSAVNFDKFNDNDFEHSWNINLDSYGSEEGIISQVDSALGNNLKLFLWQGEEEPTADLVAGTDYTAPEAKSGLFYNGSAQKLLTEGAIDAAKGTMEYALKVSPVELDSGETYDPVVGDVIKPSGWNGVNFPTNWSVKIGDDTYAAYSNSRIGLYVNVGTYCVVGTTYYKEIKAAWGDNDAFRVTAVDPQNSTVTIEFIDSANATVWSTEVPEATDAGTYDVMWRIKGAEGYNDVEAQTIEATIAKADSSVTTAPTAKTVTYDGSAQKLVTEGTASGGTMMYALDGADSAERTLTESEIKEGNIYKPSTSTGFVFPTDWRIRVDGFSMVLNQAYIFFDAGSGEYYLRGMDCDYGTGWTREALSNGEKAFKVKSINTSGGYTNVILEGVTSTATEWSENIPKATDAGEYTVFYKVFGDANHKDSAAGFVTSTIKQATLTITANAKSKTYGDDDPALTYTSSGLVEGDNITGALTREAGNNVGTYAIKLGTLTAGDNYTISFTGANFTINRAGLTNPSVSINGWTYGNEPNAPEVSGNSGQGVAAYLYKVKDADDSTYNTKVPTNAGDYTVKAIIPETQNYNGASVTANFTIAKKSLTITANAKSKTYGEEDPALTYTSSGLVEGDNITGALTREAGNNVGTYAIKLGTLTAGDNYTISFTGANFTINRAGLTNPSVSINGWTYGNEPNAPEVSGNSGQGVAAYLYKVNGADDSTYNTKVPTNAGDYTVKAIIPETQNYNGASVTANFTIAKKALTITANAKSKTYGEEDPALTYTSSGLVEGDNITGALTREAGNNVGTYAIKLGTLTAGDNYTISFTGANFTINKADFSNDLNVSIDDWVAGTTAKTPSVDGNVSEGEVSYQYKAIDAEDSSYKSTPPTTAGAYTVKATVAETANYKAATATANFTVIAPNFTTPSYSWNKVDGKWNCTASRTCTNAASLSETETVTATSSVKTPAKCEENGTTTYTATFENKAFAAQTKDVADIPATGHHYGLPKWIINKDFTEAQAVFGCKDCDEGQEIVDAEITSVTTEPTYTSAGKTVYTAYVVFNGKGYSYEKTVTIPKIGLTHVEAVEPTCTEAGNIEYWFDAANEKYFTDANGENEITQAKTVVKAKGHSYGAPEWTWSDDNSATAKFTCSEGDDEQIVKATVTSKTTDPTYIAEGKTVYTATVTFGGKSYTDTKTVTTDKLTYTAPTVSFLRGDGAVKLEWNAVDGAEQYGIAGYIDGKWTLLDKTNDTSFILTPLTAGEEYRVAVVTKLNGKWFNDFSKSILVSPKAPEVHVYPQITSIDYNEQYHQFKLNWSAVPNAENYGVAVYLAGKWKILTQTIPAGTTSFTSPKLKAGQTYKMLVCAKVNGKWDLNAMTSRAFEVTVK